MYYIPMEYPFHVSQPIVPYMPTIAYGNPPITAHYSMLAGQQPMYQVERTPFYPYNQEAQRAITDHGPHPFVVNIEKAAKKNHTYRTALWTGQHLQVTLMSINVGEDIGLEIHPTVDQFLRIEQGQGVVQMGHTQHHLDFVKKVKDNDAIMIPAGTWHNVTNTGTVPLKLYSIYAPPQHPHGTIHTTKAEAMAAE